MNAHCGASSESQNLCEKLFKLLSIKIPKLQCKQTKQWCALFEPGRNRFAYVSHRKTKSTIEVWCAGDVDQLLVSSKIKVTPRNEIRKGWEERFPARFVINNEREITEACDLLYSVSYKSS